MSDYADNTVSDDRSEQLDQDQLQPQPSLNDRGVDDALDEGYSPPEKPSVLLREGEHDTMDARLSEEEPEPDPYAEPEQEDNLPVRDELEKDRKSTRLNSSHANI